MTPAELKNLFDRYLKGEATEAEKQLVDDWYASYKDWHELSAADEERLQTEIHGDIHAGINKPPAKLRRIKWMRYAAAIAIVMVSVSLFIRKKSITTVVKNEGSESFTSIKTKTGEVKKISLPDGSSVWLNAKSELRISNTFQYQQQRYVYLDEGEAFFEVTKNPQRPFLVKTKHITTRVLGTSFNVRAYHLLKQAVVTVRTGKVQVNNHKKLLGMLTPNMQVSYNATTGNSALKKVDASAVRSWTGGKLILNKATFNELAFAIANTYGVQLTSSSKAAANYRYNIQINTSRTLDETLRIICSVHQNHYRRNNNEVIIY